VVDSDRDRNCAGKILRQIFPAQFPSQSRAAGQMRRQINLAAHITVFMNTIELRMTWTMGPCNFFVRGRPTLQTAESAEWPHDPCRNGAKLKTAPFGGAPPNGASICNVNHGLVAIPAKNCGDGTLAGADAAALLTGSAMPPNPVLFEGVPRGATPKINLRPKSRVD